MGERDEYRKIWGSHPPLGTPTSASRIRPKFIRWTDWILDGDAVVYGYPMWPSACRWLVPGTVQP